MDSSARAIEAPDQLSVHALESGRTAPISLSGARLGLILYGDIDERTGGNIYDRELLRALGSFGATSTVLGLRDPDAPGATGASVDDLVEEVAAGGFDVLLQDELCHRDGVQINRALGLRRGPLRLAVVHNLGYHALPFDERHSCRRSERRYLETVDGYVANSQVTRADVNALLPDPPPGVVAYPSLSPDLQPVGPARSQDNVVPRILSVANLSPVKGTHLLLQALGPLDGCPWTLELVGSTERDQEYVASLVRLVEELGLEQRVVFTGELRGDALRAAFGRADVMVLASPAEGFGIACLEGMHCGLPVIASTRGAAPELISHGADGLLVDPEDQAAFTSLLLEVLSGRPLLRRLGSAASARAARHPRWEESGGASPTF